MLRGLAAVSFDITAVLGATDCIGSGAGFHDGWRTSFVHNVLGFKNSYISKNKVKTRR
jgi:hypothetical protein